MNEYPKIESLYNRDENFKVDPTRLRMPEFALINRWLVTEKIDGTNIRIILTLDGTVEIRGRTDKAQIPIFLLSYLRDTFTQNVVRDALVEGEIQTHEYVLYGEGYGRKIQKAGSSYRPDDVSFRLFDVKVGGFWLNWENVEDIARKMGICTVPVLGGTVDFLPTCRAELEDIAGNSVVAMEDSENVFCGEGIVARTDPHLLTRRGKRMMWKLKHSDWA